MTTTLLILIFSGFQVVSLPNLHIIDIGYGFTGSAHDATAWEEIQMAKDHTTLLEDAEFVWADSAYLVQLSRLQ